MLESDSPELYVPAERPEAPGEHIDFSPEQIELVRSLNISRQEQQNYVGEIALMVTMSVSSGVLAAYNVAWLNEISSLFDIRSAKHLFATVALGAMSIKTGDVAAGANRSRRVSKNRQHRIERQIGL